MSRKIEQFDISRKKVDNKNTLTFIDNIKKLDSLGIGMSLNMMSKLLCVSKSSLYRWEKEQLIFPLKEGTSKRRKFKYKDIVRGFTIKFLMSQMGYRKFIGVRLLLEMTNQVVTSKDEPIGSINNYRIDRYLMKVLNYDVETIALMRLDNRVNRKEKEIVS